MAFYDDLPTAKSTRLFTLHPGNDDEPLHGRLRTVDLEVETIGYIAISYAWGSLEKPHSIKIDHGGTEAELPITLNLFTCLKKIRRRGRRRGIMIDLWVDAVCINQAHDARAYKERARQVRMMNVIFGKAKAVLVDLGDLPVHWDDFKTLLERVDALPDEAFREDDRLLQADSVLASLQESSPAWVALHDVLQRKYWTRIWCVQESILAKTLCYMLGDNTYDESFIESLSRLVLTARSFQRSKGWGTSETVLRNLRGVLLLISTTYRLRDELSKGPAERFSICQLFIDFIDLDATDPRDRFFALYGITNWTVVENVPEVDYSMSVRRLSLEVSNTFIQNKALHLLLFCANCLRSDFPSWALNLTSKNRFSGVYLFPAAKPDYRACGSTISTAKMSTSSTSLEISTCVLERIAELHNYTYDEAVSLLDSSSGECHADAVRQKLKDWGASVKTWAASFLLHQPLDQMIDAVGRTMVADLDERKIRSSPGIIQAYNCWQEHPTGYPEAALTKFCPSAFKFDSMLQKTRGQIMAGTSHKRLALVPWSAEIGDEICIFAGIEVPFVIRRHTEGGESHYRLVGQCYLHGMMDGQALEREDWNLSNIFLD